MTTMALPPIGISLALSTLYHIGYWGVSLMFISSLFLSSGLCIQKIFQRKKTLKLIKQSTENIAFIEKGESELGHESDSIDPNDTSMQIAGGTYVTIGILLRSITDTLLPLSTIAPLSALTIIFSTLLESIFLKSTALSINSYKTVLYLVTIVLGIVLCLRGGSYIDGFYAIKDINKLFIRIPTMTIIATGIAVSFTLRELAKSKSLAINRQSDNTVRIQGQVGLLYLSFTAACLGSLLSLLTKAVLEVLKYSLVHGGVVGNVVSLEEFLYVLAIVAVGFAKMMFVGYGLADYHHAVFLPLYHAMTILFTSLGGIVFFSEFDENRWLFYPISEIDAITAPADKAWMRIHSREVGSVNPFYYYLGLTLIVGASALMATGHDLSKYVSVPATYLVDESTSLLSPHSSLIEQEVNIFNEDDPTESQAGIDIVSAGEMSILQKNSPSTNPVNYYGRLTAGLGSSRRGTHIRESVDGIEENLSLDEESADYTYGSTSNQFSKVTRKFNSPPVSDNLERSSRRAALLDYAKSASSSNLSNDITSNQSVTNTSSSQQSDNVIANNSSPKASGIQGSVKSLLSKFSLGGSGTVDSQFSGIAEGDRGSEAEFLAKMASKG